MCCGGCCTHFLRVLLLLVIVAVMSFTFLGTLNHALDLEEYRAAIRREDQNMTAAAIAAEDAFAAHDLFEKVAFAACVELVLVFGFFVICAERPCLVVVFALLTWPAAAYFVFAMTVFKFELKVQIFAALAAPALPAFVYAFLVRTPRTKRAMFGA